MRGGIDGRRRRTVRRLVSSLFAVHRIPPFVRPRVIVSDRMRTRERTRIRWKSIAVRLFGATSTTTRARSEGSGTTHTRPAIARRSFSDGECWHHCTHLGESARVSAKPDAAQSTGGGPHICEHTPARTYVSDDDEFWLILPVIYACLKG